MERLRSRYLSVPLTAVLHPASLGVQEAVTQQKAAAEAIYRKVLKDLEKDKRTYNRIRN